jgi:MATE family multidrug resistance protein
LSQSKSKLAHETKLLAKLSGPIVVGQVGQNLINLADTLMVGALGALPLSASAFAGSIFIIALIAGMGIISPVTALFAKVQGQEDYPMGGVLLRHSMIVTLITSAVLIGILFAILPNLSLFGQTPEVLAEGRKFYEIIAWSVLPSLVYQCYKQFSDGIGRTKVGMTVMLLGVLLNVIGNYALIYGHWGAPALGLEGAGYSTLISRILMAISMMAYIHFNPAFTKYLQTRWIHRLDHHMLKNMLRLGLPNGLTYLFEVSAFSFAAIMMGWFGSMPLAAHQITISMASMTFLVSVGIGIASSIRVAYEWGRGDIVMARYAGFTSMKVGGVYSIICATLILILRNWLPTLYVKDVDVIELAAMLFVVVGIFQIADSIQAVAIGALRGLSDTAWPSAIAFISYWIVGLPGGYLLAFHMGMGPVGIWIGLLLGLTCTSILLPWRFHYLTNRLLDKPIYTNK